MLEGRVYPKSSQGVLASKGTHGDFSQNLFKCLDLSFLLLSKIFNCLPNSLGQIMVPFCSKPAHGLPTWFPLFLGTHFYALTFSLLIAGPTGYLVPRTCQAHSTSDSAFAILSLECSASRYAQSTSLLSGSYSNHITEAFPDDTIKVLFQFFPIQVTKPRA